MDLFPIGTMSAGVNTGTIDGVTYSFFEPNISPTSHPIFTSLQTRFQNQTILSRKKASPYLSISYEYKDIFSSEFRQIDHFLYSKDDAVTSFYVVDLSKGELPTAIDTSSTWTASISNTRLFDTIVNQKANYVFFYNGVSWKLGTVTAITTNTSVECDVDTNNYGALSDSDGAIVTGNRPTMIYPVYQCFANPNSLNAFKTTNYVPNDDVERGHMYSGIINFITKYKV